MKSLIKKKYFQLSIVLVIFSIIRIWGAVHNIIPTASELNYLKAIENMTNTVSLDTQYYNHPDNIIIILGFVVINVVCLLTKHTLATGTISQVITKSTIPAFFEQNMLFYLSIGRIINVVISLIGLVFVFLISEKIKKNSGKYSVIFAALFPSYNVWSGCILSDTCLTTLVLIAIYFAIIYLHENKTSYMYISTIFCGLATMQKYTGLLACSIIVTIVVYRAVVDNKGVKDILLSILSNGIKQIMVFFATVVVAGPNVVTNFGKVIQILQTESRTYHPGADGLGFWGNLSFYVSTFWTQMGIIVCVLSFFGIVYLIKNRVSRSLPFVFAVVFTIVLSVLKLHWERWGLSIYAIPIILAGIGMQCLIDYFNNHQCKRNLLLKSVLIITVGIASFAIFSDVWLDTIVKSLPDTRIVSQNEIKELHPEISTSNTYAEYATSFVHKWYDERYDDEEREQNAEYYMLSSYNYDPRFKSELYSPEQYYAKCEWYREVFDSKELVYSITPWIKYKLYRDVTEYGNVEYTLPIIKMFTNMKLIIEYYQNPIGKYYGPEIRVYRSVKENH